MSFPGRHPRLRRLAGAAVTGLALSSLPSLARASESSAGDAARTRYLAGARDYSQGAYADAVTEFLAADRLAPSPALSYDIARAYEKMGNTSLTLRWYRDYLHRVDNPPDGAKVRQKIASLENELQKKGVQQVTVRSVPRGAALSIDGEASGVTPWTSDLPPGPHRLAFHLDGYEDIERQFTLPPDAALDIDVRLSPRVATSEATPPPPAAEGPRTATRAPPGATAESVPTETRKTPATLRTIGIVGMSVGGAALGGALAFELLREKSVDDAKKDPTQVGYASKLRAANDRQTAARVLLGVGAGLAVTGGVLFFVGQPSKGGADVAFGCGPVGCGAFASGRF